MKKQYGRLSFGNMISAFEVMKDVGEKLHKNRELQHCSGKEDYIMKTIRRTIERLHFVTS